MAELKVLLEKMADTLPDDRCSQSEQQVLKTTRRASCLTENTLRTTFICCCLFYVKTAQQ